MEVIVSFYNVNWWSASIIVVHLRWNQLFYGCFVKWWAFDWSGFIGIWLYKLKFIGSLMFADWIEMIGLIIIDNHSSKIVYVILNGDIIRCNSITNLISNSSQFTVYNFLAKYYLYGWGVPSLPCLVLSYVRNLEFFFNYLELNSFGRFAGQFFLEFCFFH